MTAGWRVAGGAEGELTSDDIDLLDAALAVADNAYAPYSGFRVGAALRAADGRIVTGCNIENAAYPSGICAERAAVARAISEGVRAHVAVAVVGSGAGPTTPCGMCRQVLNELSPQIRVLSAGSDGQVAVADLPTLLPAAFGPGNLGLPGSDNSTTGRTTR